MVSKLRYIFVFQRKFLLPAIIISLFLGVVGHSINGKPIVTNAGFAYLFVLPLFQYLVYELRYPNEYYFYHNLGISKVMLWAACLAQGFIVNVATSFL
ncbi:MAG: hypothetical protein ACFB15_01005 [Cyclobacteriaceae bacterium]